MKTDADDDEMQQIQQISDFLFYIFSKPRVTESADEDQADKVGLL